MGTDLLIVAAVAAGTLAMRASMVTLLANVTISDRVEQALSLVAPAVLAGLVAQTLFLDHGEWRPFGTWYVAGAVAAFVSWRTRSFGWTLVAGMGSVWLLEALP
ncbi:MAG: AzlD domain-containing protein [Chloroflexota bacterium]|jgi:branched-subunit amino acid transport protein